MALEEQELTQKFEEAVESVRKNPPKKSLTTKDRLLVYGLYKQATIGDNKTAKPWAVQVEKRAKWDAWKKQKGKSKQEAMADYVIEVERQLAL